MTKNVIKTQVSRQYILNIEVTYRLLFVFNEGKHQNFLAFNFDHGWTGLIWEAKAVWSGQQYLGATKDPYKVANNLETNVIVEALCERGNQTNLKD